MRRLYCLFLLFVLFACGTIFAYTDYFKRGTTYSRQLEFVHPTRGPITASINPVDAHLDNINSDLTFWKTGTFTFRSIGNNFNATIENNGKFTRRSKSSAADSTEVDFVVLANNDQCWAVRTVNNYFTPFEYTSVACDASPVVTVSPEFTYVHPSLGAAVLSLPDHGVTPKISSRFVADNSTRITQSFMTQGLLDQPINVVIDHVNLKFKVRESVNHAFAFTDQEFINIKSDNGTCIQVRMKRVDDHIKFERMPIRCDFEEIGGPVEYETEKFAFESPEGNMKVLSVKSKNVLQIEEDGKPPIEVDNFDFITNNGASRNAAVESSKSKFKVRNNKQEQFKNVHSIIAKGADGKFYQLSLLIFKDSAKFSVAKLKGSSSNLDEFIHTKAIYSLASSSIHTLQLARLIGNGSGALNLTGADQSVAIIDNGFNLKTSAIKNSVIPGARHFFNDMELQGYLPGGSHGSNQASVLLGKAEGNRVGIARGAKFLPVVSYGNYAYTAQKIFNENGISLASCSLWDFDFQSVYNHGHQYSSTLPNSLLILIAGNGNGRASKLGKHLPPAGHDDVLNRIIVTVAVDARGTLTKSSSKCGATKDFCIAVPAKSPVSPTAPAVAGIVSLLREAFPNAELEDIRNALLESADEIPGSTNDQTGVGMINAYRAYLLLKEK